MTETRTAPDAGFRRLRSATGGLALWTLGFAYVAADAAGLVPFPVGPAVLPLVLAGVYLLAVIAGRIRYR